MKGKCNATGRRSTTGLAASTTEIAEPFVKIDQGIGKTVGYNDFFGTGLEAVAAAGAGAEEVIPDKRPGWTYF